MQYRTDQRSGKQLSALGFGCMRLPRGVGGIDMKRAEPLLLRAIEAGVNYFDTGYIYPGSEAALGTVLAGHGLRGRVHIATKLPLIACRGPEDFDRYFAAQLKRLQTGFIDYYLMHSIASHEQWQGLCAWGIEGWLARKKAEGAIGQVGFSFHGSQDDFLRVVDAYAWDMCQIQYNYANEHYQAGVTGLRHAAAKGMPVVVMEPLLGGKLADGLPPKARAALARENPTRTPAAWALRWLWDQPEVTVVLSGMNEPEQLEENLRTAGGAHPGMLTESERRAYAEVLRIFRETDRVPCTGCAYCMPCPAGVNIPGCFSAYNASWAMGRMAGIQQYVTGTAAYRRSNGTASRCIACGKCAKHCPQGIDIPRALGEARQRLEPFYLGWGLAVARRLMDRKPPSSS